MLDVVPLHEVRNIRDNSAQNEIIAEDESETNGTTTSNEDGADNKNVFEIETSPEGYNSGRTYQIQAENGGEFRTIFDNLTKLASAARDEAEAKSRFNKSQQRVGKVFNSNIVQLVMAILIFGVRKINSQNPKRSNNKIYFGINDQPRFLSQNFFANVVEAQIGNTLDEESWSTIFDMLNLAFTALFTAELCVNLFVNWFTPFFKSG